jgi:hypothetical protein
MTAVEAAVTLPTIASAPVVPLQLYTMGLLQYQTLLTSGLPRLTMPVTLKA